MPAQEVLSYDTDRRKASIGMDARQAPSRPPQRPPQRSPTPTPPIREASIQVNDLEKGELDQHKHPSEHQQLQLQLHQDQEQPTFTSKTTTSAQRHVDMVDKRVASAITSARRYRQCSLFVGFIILAVTISTANSFLHKQGFVSPFNNNGNAVVLISGGISLQLLQQHATPDDCWVAFHGTVYDMTTYPASHPGGAIRITSECGRDGTSAFQAIHARSLLRTVANFQLGQLSADAADASLTAPSDPTKPPSNEKCLVPSYTLQDIQQHSTRDDCWFVLYGRVWDLTSYVDRHPGSARNIFLYCGTDATDTFVRIRNHSENFVSVRVPELEIGVLWVGDDGGGGGGSYVGGGSREGGGGGQKVEVSCQQSNLN